MKGKRFLLALVLCVFLVGLALSASAATQTGSGSVYIVNPLFQDYVIPQQLAAGSASTPSTYHTTEDAVVAAIRSGMENREAVITVGYQGTADVDAMGENMYAKVMAHTGVSTQGDYLLWHYYSYSLSWETDRSTNKTVYTCQMTYLTTAEQEDIVDAQVAALLDSLNVYTASDYIKVKAIYDYLCENVVYDTYGLIYGNRIIYTAYSALVRNRAVCQGYASLFYRLALELGVDARLIPGIGSGGAHGWNIVKLGDYYYNLDSTWDAEIFQAGGEYEYFLKSPYDFDDHTRKEEYDNPGFHENYPMDTDNYDPLTDPGFEPARNGWDYVAGKWFFYQDDVPATGWKLIGGKWYYFDYNSSIMLTGWLDIGGTWYYLSESGAMVTGVVTIGNEQHSFGASGAWQGRMEKNGWFMEAGNWFYYQSNRKTTGWLKLGNTWYYLDNNGIMQIGWLKSGNIWYYLRSSGAMATGWEQVSGKWYYLDASGAMATGWLKLGNIWYYLQPSGAMQTGWLKDVGTWYYFHSSGAMATGSVKIGAKTYNFSTSGACLNP